jgi:hypothetical protein
MSGNKDNSFLTRPPKLPPAAAVTLGVVCIPLGFVIKGPIGGGLIGGGVGAILMGVWDFARLTFVAWISEHKAGVPDHKGP